MKTEFNKYHHRQYAWALLRTHCADYSRPWLRKRKITDDWESHMRGFLYRRFYDADREERIPDMELFKTRREARQKAREVNNHGYHYVVKKVEVSVKEL
jgi:hypothetical protein